LTLASPKLIDLVDPRHILDLDVTTKGDALRRLSDSLAEDSRLLDGEVFHRAILRREQQVSTGVGMGIAIPHVKIPEVTDYVMAIGRVRGGIDFDALDGKPVYLVFMIGASDRQTREFVKLLAQVTRLLKSAAVRQALMEAAIPDPFIDVIRSNER